MGLKETHHIGRIIVHPANPDIVYVAAVGHLWGTNPERGIFKSEDGGATWNKVLYLDERTGATDLVADPENPDVLYAALHQRGRTVAALVNGGPETGIYKSTDGGNTWNRLKKGLPGGDVGKSAGTEGDVDGEGFGRILVCGRC